MGKTVLVVEDDPTIRDVVAAMLRLEGFTTRVAADGVEALEQLGPEGGRPDLIVLDLMMPRMDGYAFAEELKRRGLHARIPIVVLTADTYLGEKIEQIGARGYLTKPFDLDDLLDELARVANGRPTA